MRAKHIAIVLALVLVLGVAYSLLKPVSNYIDRKMDESIERLVDNMVE